MKVKIDGGEGSIVKENERPENWVEHCIVCKYTHLMNSSDYPRGARPQASAWPSSALRCPHCVPLRKGDSHIDGGNSLGFHFEGKMKNRQLVKDNLIKARVVPKQQRAFCHGVWDIIHVATTTSLFSWASDTESLTVGVANDVSVAEATGLIPIFTLEERRRMISAVKVVDRVIYNIDFNFNAEKLGQIKCSNLIVNSVPHATCIHPHVAGRKRFLNQQRYRSHNQTNGETGHNELLRDGVIKEYQYNHSDRYDSIALIYLLRLSVRYAGILMKQSSLEERFGKQIKCLENNATADNQFIKQLYLPYTWATLTKRTLWSQCLLSSLMLEQRQREVVNQVDDQPVFNQLNLSIDTHHKSSDFLRRRREEMEEKVAFLDGAFDVLHPGHLDLIESAKSRFGATKLVVGILSDEAIYKASNELPCFAMIERAMVVQSLRGVDQVIFDCPWELSSDMLKEYNVDVVIQRLELHPGCGYGFAVKRLNSIAIYRAALNELVVPVEKCDISISTRDVLLRVLNQMHTIKTAYQEHESLLARNDRQWNESVYSDCR